MELDKEKWDNELRLQGPFSFRYDSDNYIFKQNNDGRKSGGVYLLTIRSNVDRNYYVHYVGEAQNVAIRQLHHLSNMLGISYGIWDIEKSRQIALEMTLAPEDAKKVKHGKFGIMWEGLWRLSSEKSPLPLSNVDILGEYKRLNDDVIAYVKNIDIFFANTKEFKKPEEPIEAAEVKKIRRAYDRKRKHIEGSIADMLETYPKEVYENIAALYPRDNTTGVSKHMDLKLRIYFPRDVIIMGLNHDREKVKYEGEQEFVEIMV